MDAVYRELDDIKAEMEKLKAECRVKTELIGSLKKDRNEEFLKLQESRQQGEKQARELDLKTEEIFELKKLYEDIKANLHEKEMYIAHLSSENKNIKGTCAERLLQLEENNRVLALASDELTARNNHLEQNACAHSKEISDLKALLSATEKKYLEAEEKAREARMLRQRDDVIMKLEEENLSVQEKMKWRNEQFKHLEDAHKTLQVQFQLSKEEWEKERSALLGEISSLQNSLDSQTRMVKGLESRLEMCNHALACEESKRKLLEAEISEFKSRFEDIYTQCEAKKSEIQELTILRNEEIAQLRSRLAEKEMLVRELEHKVVHLEQDNQELEDSLKELREAQIQNAGGNSLISKLRNKLKRLEEVHKTCSSVLKSKESEWEYQVEKMEADISTYQSTLTTKDQEIRELQMELEKCYHTIEENQVEVLILKSELAEAYSKSISAETDKVAPVKENEDIICLSVEQLGVEETSPKTMAWEHFMLEEELEQQKKMLEESSTGQLVLKGQLLQMESTLKHEKSIAFEALETLKLEIAKQNDELSRLYCEVQNYKSIAETLHVSYEEVQGNSKKMEASLLSQIENEQAIKFENENLLLVVKGYVRKFEDLEQQIALLEMYNAEKIKEAERCRQEKEGLAQIAEEKDCCIKDLQREIAIACLKQESLKKELEDAVIARLDAKKVFAQEKEMLLMLNEEKDQTIKHFQDLATTMEQDLLVALCLSFSKQVEKWVEVSVLSETLTNAEYLTKLEIEEKNIRIVQSEMEIENLLHNFAHTEESFFHLKEEAKQVQASLEAMKLENEKLTEKQQTMEGIITELKLEIGNLLQDIMKLSTEREDMLVGNEYLCDRIGGLSSEDKQLMEKLGNILNTCVDENEAATDLVVCDELHDSATDRANGSQFPSTIKKHEENFGGRSPLREVINLHL